MRISVRTKLFVAFGLAFTIIATTALISLDNATRLTENAERLTHARDLADELHAIGFALYAAEAAQREFATTRHALFLESYEEAVRDAAQSMARLRLLASGSPARELTIGVLERQVGARLDELDQGLESLTASSSGFGGYVVATGAGTRTMDAIRNTVAAIHADQDALRDGLEAAQSRTARANVAVIVAMGVAAALLFILAYALSREISKGVSAIARAMRKISEGDLSEEVRITSSDEIGDMATSYREMQAYLLEAASSATHIGQGDLDSVASPRGPLDALGNARAAMVRNLKQHAHAAERMANGDLSVDVTPLSNRDVLGNAFAHMIAKLRWMIDTLEDTAGQRSEALALAETRASALKRSNEELDALSRIARVLAAPGPFEENARKMLAVVAEIVGADRAAVRLPDKGRRHLVSLAEAGPRASDPRGPRVIGRDGASNRAFLHREIVVEQDHEARGKYGRSIVGNGPRSNVTLPIAWGETVCGVLKVSSEQPNFFSDDSVRLLTAIADSLGVLIENARLRESLEESLETRRVALARVEASAAALHRSNTELEQFAYIASHDLQEPLRKIRAFATRLEATQADAFDETGKGYLARMTNAAARMQTLIDDLLSYARVTSKGEAFQSVDLNRIAQEVLGDLEVAIEEATARVEIVDLPTADADPSQMRQLLQNLVSNAIKFRRPGESPVVRILGLNGVAGGTDLEADGEVVRFAVEDDGIGFEPEYADRIFTVFQRLHGRAAYEGTGVGLAVCMKIAQRHGGTITATGHPGHGARFVVSMPKHHAEGGSTDG